jgi:hypothetical protein
MTYPINLPRFPPDPEEWLPGDLSKGEPPLPRWLFRGNYRSGNHSDIEEWRQLLEEISSHPPEKPGVYGFGS